MIELVTAADKNYLFYLSCHLSSIGRRSETYKITVIHRDIDPSYQKELGKLIPAPHELHWFKPNVDHLKKIGAPLFFANSSPHYFRLLCPYLLSASSRVLYLDADTLVLEDLFPLWTHPLSPHPIGAVPDYIPCISEGVGNWRELSLDPKAPYFNSGVLLMDLDLWRKEEIAEKVLKVCQSYPEFLIAQKKWPQYDQYGLNVVLQKRWQELEKRWNYGTDSPFKKAPILHYIGNGKIGGSKCHPEFRQIFYELLPQIPGIN